MGSVSQYGEFSSAVLNPPLFTPRVFKPLAVSILLFGGPKAFSGEWFNHGTGFVDIKDPRSKGADCGRCHIQIWEDWKKSQHSQAFEDPLFQSGYEDEGKFIRCRFCHDPLGGSNTGPPLKMSDGVSCAVCHIRDGTIVGVNEPRSHGGRKDDFLKSPEFCGGCHQFNFLANRSGMIPGQLPSQNTLEEWKAYAAAGGKKTCQTCHMPGGRHLFWGAHDSKRLRQAFHYSVRRIKKGVLFTAWTKEVGHDWPTGDLFRSVRLEIASSIKGPYQLAAEFSRPLRYKKDPQTGVMNPVIVSDTRLKPFEKRAILIENKKAIYFRWTYHFCSSWEETKGHKENQPVNLSSGHIP